MSQGTMINKLKKKLTDALPALVVLIILFFGLELVIILFNIPQTILPRPTVIVRETIRDFKPVIMKDWLSTLKNLFGGYLLAVSLGIVLAAILAQSKLSIKAFSPLVLMLAVTPLVVLVPMFMVWMGFNQSVRIYCVALTSTPIILINTLTGFVNVEKDKLEIARVYAANRVKMFFKIVLPQAWPRIFAGMRLGVINATLGIIATEFISGIIGMGYRITISCTFLNMPIVFGCIIIVGLTTRVLMMIVTQIEKRIVVWKQ